MPLYVQPLSLEDLCYQAAKSYLVTLFQQLDEKKITPRLLRKSLISSLPGVVRTRILAETVDSNDAPVPFYFMNLLLASDVDKLKIELCCYYCCSHQAAILRLLASEGKGLRSLELARSALLRLDQSLLQSVLLNTSNLQHLKMRNIATDATLAVIGSSCDKLVVLDVCNSRQVTDNGITNLFIKIELRDKSDLSDLSNIALSMTTRPRNNKWRNLFRAFRNIQQTIGSCQGGKYDNRSESYNDILLECHESLNPLTSTLKVLNISNTAVTRTGVFLALDNSKCLQSVGDYQHMYHVLQIFLAKYETPPTFKLKYARTSETTVKTINLINKLCPHMEVIYAIDVKFSPRDLIPNTMPKTLRSLILIGIPPSTTWVQDLYYFLGNLEGITISELVLKFFATDNLIDIELDELLSYCPKLRILVIDGASMSWPSNTPITKKFHLERIHLGQIVHGKVLGKLINNSPNLRTAHFYNCPHLNEHDLIALQNNTLKCLYIYETRLTTVQSIVSEIVYNCPNLRYIGNVTNWGTSIEYTCNILQYVQDKNYNMQFKAGPHWYYSTCINKYE